MKEFPWHLTPAYLLRRIAQKAQEEGIYPPRFSKKCICGKENYDFSLLSKYTPPPYPYGRKPVSGYPEKEYRIASQIFN